MSIQVCVCVCLSVQLLFKSVDFAQLTSLRDRSTLTRVLVIGNQNCSYVFHTWHVDTSKPLRVVLVFADAPRLCVLCYELTCMHLCLCVKCVRSLLTQP